MLSGSVGMRRFIDFLKKLYVEDTEFLNPSLLCFSTFCTLMFFIFTFYTVLFIDFKLILDVSGSKDFWI